MGQVPLSNTTGAFQKLSVLHWQVYYQLLGTQRKILSKAGHISEH